MDTLALIHPVPAAWLHGSALAPFVPAYWHSLVEQHYAAGTTRQYLCGVAHFARWMRRHRLAVSALDEDVVQRFLEEHLPRCTCPSPVQRSRHQIRAALRHLLVLLDNADVLFSTHVPNAVEEELRRFGEYMEHARGLAENTRIQRLNILRPFLRKNGSANRHKWTAPTAADLRRFITLKLQRWSPASANALAGALRCYLRFRAMCGDPVGHLLPAIASPANWRLAPLPQTLSQIQVTQLLDSFSPDLPSALRAYAMVRCVVDLGPRASEVVSLSEALHLCDTDVDLQGATLTIRQTKFNKSRCLPVQQSVVQALADYRQLRDHAVARSVNMPFFVSSKGSGLLKHTVDYVFGQLRDRLRWHPRGEHPHPRIQDLRHYAERRIMPNNR